MRSLILSLLTLSLACAMVFAQTPGGSTKVVDFQADVIRPIQIPGDSSVLNLLGHVVFYHNGAVITCDSAVRYNDKRMECFRNVVVNKDSTYIYGDRADYNGEINEARIYAPIIKMVDGDATLYTYHFKFNTLDNIGEYSGGGTMSQGENLLESMRGYYYADLREIVCVDSVEIRNPDYRLKSDSVGYNMDSRIATFFNKSYIWNSKGEILSARRGEYLSATRDYKFSRDAYILTDTREFWADSLDYDSLQNAVMWGNIQIREEEHKVMAFGDFGRYWGERQDAMLTRNPSLVSYDPEQDTLYMRADSMFLYSIDKNIRFNVDTTALMSGTDTGEEELIIPEENVVSESSLPQDKGLDGDSTSFSETMAENLTDSLSLSAENASEQRAGLFGGSAQRKAQRALERQKKQEEKRLEREAKQRARAEKKNPDEREVVLDGGEDLGRSVLSDTLAVTSVTDTVSIRQDTIAVAEVKIDESVVIDSLPQEVDQQSEVVTDSLSTTSESSDSLQRIVKGYYNVKVFRKDMQAVGDSTVAFSIDSTLHLYINPVMWNENNQVTADVIDLYTQNQQLYKAVFVGTPMMVSQEDTVHYNQVKGKEMEAYFKNNEIERLDVNGNGQTYYYMKDDKTGELTGFLVAECADIRFDFEDKQLLTIRYLLDPEYTIYPMDKIPVDQELYLPGFHWEGARRPTLEDVFNRTIRPSQREEYEKLPQPSFPLTDSILENRNRMIREGIWRERNDTLSPEALDFIRSIINR